MSWLREMKEARADLGEDWRWWHWIPQVHLLTPAWWRYILAPRNWDTPLLSAAICRWRGHPCGEVFFNPGGYEPDHHCKNCGDNIG